MDDTRYTVLIYWSDEDQEYVAHVTELEGCTATGETPDEALREVQVAMGLWLAAAQANGFPIPAPNHHPQLARAS